MSNKNIKVYKNSERDKPEIRKKYVPQYQIMGVEPEEFKSAVVPDNVLIAKSNPQIPPTNPRGRRPAIRQPYAKVIPSPVGRGRGPVPNVGNNMEHTWSSVDGEIVDDLSDQMIDHQQSFIDNNDIMTDDALGFIEEDESEDTEVKSFLTKEDLQNVIRDSNLPEVIDSIKDDEYILLVNNTVLSVGSFEQIQEETKELIFGEHKDCGGNSIPVEDLVVLKRVKIKIGVFLE